MAKVDLSADRLRECVAYDPLTGEFIRLKEDGARPKTGSIDKDGYVRVVVDGSKYAAHRLAWLYVHGSWPDEFIDHINGNRADNRLCNLREATATLNCQNLRQGYGRSGLLGAAWVEKYQQWRATIRTNGRRVNLGDFHSKEDAHEAYIRAKRRLHEGCTI